MSRVKELDGLRAIAILGVFLAHFTPVYGHVSDILYLGWAGVDLFFALSGFLITNILIGLRGQDASFKTFYWRRTLRILPPYYAALILILLLGLLHREHIPYGATLRCWLFLSSVTPGLVKLAISRLFFHAQTAFPAYRPVTKFYLTQFTDCLGIYWSLSVEELFYLVWAPIILRGTRRLVLFCSAAPLLLCPILRGLAHTSPHIGETVGFVFRFDSLAAGGCVALLFVGTEKGYLKQRFVDCGLVVATIFSSLSLLFLCGFCGVFRGTDVRTTWSFSVLGYTLLAILCASVVGACVRWSGNPGLIPRFARSKGVVYLGTISYTMYLIHLPVYVLIQLAALKYLGKGGAPEFSPGLVLLCGVLAIVCTIVLASLSWRYFERPILQLKDRRFPSHRRSRPVLSAAEATTV